MAHALRTVLLEPEEQHESSAPKLRPLRRKRTNSTVWQMSMASMTMVMVGIAVIVGLGIAYISTYARIAQNEFRHQALQQELAQLNRECVQLNLELDRLSAQPRLAQVAQAQGLELPTADRVHYVRVQNDLPRSTVAQADRDARQHSWRRQLVAALDQTLQRLGRGPGAPAYAHE